MVKATNAAKKAADEKRKKAEEARKPKAARNKQEGNATKGKASQTAPTSIVDDMEVDEGDELRGQDSE
jgi:membrane protein involved in colicin uptake